MAALILIAAVLSLAIGAGVLWANPHRLLNKAFAGSSLISATWLLCVFMAMSAGLDPVTGAYRNPLPWVRAASAAGAFLPFTIWLMKEFILSALIDNRRFIGRAIVLILISCGLASLCYADSFVFDEVESANRSRGLPYGIYITTSIGLYAMLIVQTFRDSRELAGIRRLELQFLILNAGIVSLFALIVLAAGNIFDLRFLPRLAPGIIIVFYALTAWAVTFHRVFDARQVFVSLGQRLALIAALCLGIFGLRFLFALFVSAPFDLILSIALAGPLVFWLDRSSRDWLQLSPAQRVAALRRDITDLARAQPDPDKLVGELEQLLRASYQASFASLLFDSGEVYAGDRLQLAKNRPGHYALCKDGWATPESLQRQRPVPGLVDLRQILTEHGLGLLVTAPRNSPAPALVAALGAKVNHRPFTYPEVQQLQDVAEFLDNILARSRLTLQARQSEQLAVIGLVGASLAHEIRNPLVSIKTFAHLLPTRFEDAEFRRKFHQLIPAEVDRIDGLTQQLLDLAHPRSHLLERVALHGIVRDTLDLMQTNAAKANVSLASRLDAAPDTIHADASAIRQVLINLLINAVQALENQEGARAVELNTRRLANGAVVLEIADNGPGIPDDQRSRLFRPFASTKTRGIGLGLAICADILREHRATINVPDTGRPGATFRITFPCPPPSS